MSGENEELSPLQKVAVLLIALGAETATEILKQMDEDEAEIIVEAIARMETVTSEQQDAVLNEFEQLLRGGRFISEGGVGFARDILQSAVGERKAEKILGRLGKKTSNGFYLLRHVDPRQLIPYITKEQPQTIALILSQLAAEQAAGVFNNLPDTLRSDVAYRMSQLGDVAPETLQELEESLALDMEAILEGRMTTIGGIETVAKMLNEAGQSEDVLGEIEDWDVEVAEAIRSEMFTFYDIADLDDTAVRELTLNVDKNDLAMALKGADADEGIQKVKDKVFRTLSVRVKNRMVEDIDFMGMVRKSEVDQARQHIVAKVIEMDKKTQDEGQGVLRIVRGDGGEEYVR